jgi:hypothetical protein
VAGDIREGKIEPFEQLVGNSPGDKLEADLSGWLEDYE